MNQTLVANVNNKNVYLINNNDISFYVCFPNSNKASIVLNLVDNANSISMNNNMVNITNEITNIYSKFNYGDIAVVSPVVDSNLLEQVKLNNDGQVFNYLDKIMSYLINTVYKILKDNNIEVDNKIKLNNNKNYSDFNNWFIKRYNERVELVDYSTAPANKFDNVSSTPILDSAASEIANKALEQSQPLTPPDQSEINVSSDSMKEPGFVSYVLLGVIVAVISLVILYKLL